MSTLIRPEISPKSNFRLDRHRYYELKHFCLQYPKWKKACEELDGLNKCPSDTERVQSSNKSDSTAKCAMDRAFYTERMEMVEWAAWNAHKDLSSYILRGVTEEMPYSQLKARLDIPCSKETYYKYYRIFFWLLDKARK